MMQIALATVVGTFVFAAVFMLLSRSLIRMLLGLALLANGVNLLIFVAGRLASTTPPILDGGGVGPMSNPLPQALILTAIVIGFAMFTFLLVLVYRAQHHLDAETTDTMRLAEPPAAPQPPLGY